MTTSPKPRPFRIQTRPLALLVFACGAGAAVCVFMGCFGMISQLFELTSHFYVQYAFALALSVVALLLMRRWKPSLFLAAFLAVAIAKILPLYMPVGQRATADTPHLRVASINAHNDNTNYDAIISEIVSENPDVVSVQELTHPLLARFQKDLAQTYPFIEAFPDDHPFGIAMLSKKPFMKVNIGAYGGVNLPCILATINVDGEPVQFLAMHVLPPTSEESMHARNAEMDGLIRQKKTLGERFVIMGDLNCTSWSPYFKPWLTGLNALDTRQGFGVQQSWPVGAPVLRIPIDHILTSQNFVTLNRHLGPDIGSDHYPIVADLALRK